MLKESVDRQETELKQHFDKQGEALNVALTQAYDQRMEARKQEKNKLDAKRFLEDNALRNEVFSAFEREALTATNPYLYTPPSSESGTLPDAPSHTPPRPATVAVMESKDSVCKKVGSCITQFTNPTYTNGLTLSL